jgi:ABC-2 type transport system permease protein
VTTTASGVTGGPPAQTGFPYRQATFADALAAEWVKLRTVRSTYWTLLVAAVIGIGLGALFSFLQARQWTNGNADPTTWDPTSISTSGLGLAQLAIGVLGVLVVTAEYSSGTIRTSLAAIPHRGRFLAAKAGLFTVVALVDGEIMAFVAFLIGQTLISGHAPTAHFGQPQVLRAVIGSGLYLAALGLLGVALGTLLRSTAAAIAVLVAIVFVFPLVAIALPTSLRNSVEKFWPTQAGQQVTGVVRAAHTLPAWAGFADLCIFVAVVLAVAFILLQRRDA